MSEMDRMLEALRPTMDIFTPWGHEVIFANPTYGDSYDQHICKENLVVGKRYRISSTTVYASKTDVFLEGQRQAFNSVNFQNVPGYQPAKHGK